jgi:hypothetical protein
MKKYEITLTANYEKTICVYADSPEQAKEKIREERPTEPVDELISKVAHAPTKKVKVLTGRCNEER